MATRRKIIFWHGYHSAEFAERLRSSWENGDLLICCPPKFGDTRLNPNSGDDPFFETMTAQAVLGVYTTGTTRETPKLVLYSKENILSCQKAILELYDVQRMETIFCYPQPYHVFGLLLGYVLCLTQPHMRLLAPEGAYSTSHHQMRADLETPHCLTLGTPVHFRDLRQYLLETGRTLKPSYSCLIGGARVEKSDWYAARDLLNIEAPSIGYGCTEASPGISHLAPGLEPIADGDLGYPLSHGRITLTKDDGFVFSGPSVAIATVEGDAISYPKEIAVRDHIDVEPDGRLIFRARVDAILNRGGEKFSLDHIESFLKQHFHIENICLATRDPRLGEELAVMVKREAGLTLPRAQIFAALSQQYGRDFDEERLVEVDELPTNAQSKYDRKLAAKLINEKFPC